MEDPQLLQKKKDDDADEEGTDEEVDPKTTRKVCIDYGKGLWVEQNNGKGGGASSNTAELVYKNPSGVKVRRLGPGRQPGGVLLEPGRVCVGLLHSQHEGSACVGALTTTHLSAHHLPHLQINLRWQGRLLAALGDTKDDEGNAVVWPIILKELRGDSGCPCCDLCRAQPNDASQLTSIKCKQWSYRASDGACRLWSNANQNDKGVSLSLETKYTDWASGSGAAGGSGGEGGACASQGGSGRVEQAAGNPGRRVCVCLRPSTAPSLPADLACSHENGRRRWLWQQLRGRDKTHAGLRACPTAAAPAALAAAAT